MAIALDATVSGDSANTYVTATEADDYFASHFSEAKTSVWNEWVASGTESISFSISPSHTASASISRSPEWMGDVEGDAPDDEPQWPEPYGGSVPLKLDIEEARKALEAMEKLGGLMGDSVDDIIRRVYKDVLK